MTMSTTTRHSRSPCLFTDQTSKNKQMNQRTMLRTSSEEKVQSDNTKQVHFTRRASGRERERETFYRRQDQWRHEQKEEQQGPRSRPRTRNQQRIQLKSGKNASFA